MRPGNGAHWERKNKAGANVYTFPARARQYRTPNEIRLEVLSMVERELRRLQRSEQRRGAFSRPLSLAIDWLDLLAVWENPGLLNRRCLPQ